MDKTENFELNQWESTDRILMEDFNNDNDRIDAALKTRNCQIFNYSYTGDGAYTKVYTFPGKPVFILAMGLTQWMCSICNAPYALSIDPVGDIRKVTAEWADTSASFSGAADTKYICNSHGQPYQLLALVAL